MEHLDRRILFGAAYYHEYQPTPRLSEDLDLMQRARFSVIRVGESVWSTWEPENGRFDLDWLQPVLDGARERDIAVILGTPTYAVPPWLARLYPEINLERRTGQPIGWGARQEIDYTHPAFLFHAERLIRKIIAQYADHPAVIGFQVDNEPGLAIFHNHAVFQRFVDHLRHRYGSVEALNREWGLTYWSHRLSEWADLWTPDGNAQPQYSLAWRRFQAELTTAFITWQAEIVREYARDDQFVTTCIAYERPTVQDEELTAGLDVAAGNAYYRMQDKLALPTADTAEQGWTTSGTWSLFAAADRMYASKQAPFLVTETDAQSIGMSWQHEPAYDGQWRQVAWALISRGATMIEYWHWHTLHYGAETYWGGVLPHSQQPGRVYEQIAELGVELERAGSLVTELKPDHDVTFVFSNPSKWSLQQHPQLGGYRERDTRGYQRIVESLYRGFFDAGRQGHFVHPQQVVDLDPAEYVTDHPILVAAGLTIADDHLLQWLERYADAGGHLVLGIRTGYEDFEARARRERKPAFLDQAAGVWYDEYSTIDDPIVVIGATGGLPSTAVVQDQHSADAEVDKVDHGLAGRATRWIDGLQLDGAEPLAHYQHPHFGRWPAATSKRHGTGRVSYLGTLPDPDLARSFAAWVVDHTVGRSRWRRQAESQTVTSATAADGTRLHFVHNWSWASSCYSLPCDVVDLTSDAKFDSGQRLDLRAWDVRILAER
ncbi:MAG TPA: beta-galactosidase [Microlunatus sp.]